MTDDPLIMSIGVFVFVYVFLSAVDAIYHKYQRIKDNIIAACIFGIITLVGMWLYSLTI